MGILGFTITFDMCGNPSVPLNNGGNSGICMGLTGLRIRFDTCNSSDPSQQWVIWKPGYASDSNRVCLPTEACLTARDPISLNEYEYLLPKTSKIKSNNEVRHLKIKQSDQSQYWPMHSTTRQLSNVKVPNACITNKHLKDPANSLELECFGNDHKSPNPKLSNHQSFNPMPALDDNGEQVCIV